MLLRGTVLNLTGMVLPSLAAIPALAILARLLGVESFGLFALVFALLGYAGIFDGGLARAVIREIAINDKKEQACQPIMGTATWAVLALSIPAIAALYLGAPLIVKFIKVSPENFSDATRSFRLISLALPFYILSLVWFGYFEGKRQFLKLNILKTISGTSIAVLPAAAVLFEAKLSCAVLALVAARAATLAMLYISLPEQIKKSLTSFDRSILVRLFRFGSWMTVSNIVSPLMVYADRFILSSIVGAKSVAFYTAPSEIVSRMLIIPGAAARTMFPVFSNSQESSQGVGRTAFFWLGGVSILIATPVFFLSSEILNLWLGEPYGEKSGVILKILLVGFLFNSLAQVPFSRLQAGGYPKVTATIHLVEIVPYILALYYLIKLWGITGAALAWMARMCVDFLALSSAVRIMQDR